MREYDLDRFIQAQLYGYDVALNEIKCGCKYSHWMWYIFPQIRGLGKSTTANYYGIDGLREAKDYLSHPILSKRLLEICNVLVDLEESDAQMIFGTIDAQKLKSSMTLFALISDDNSVFHKVLGKYFNGEMDEHTISLINLEE